MSYFYPSAYRIIRFEKILQPGISYHQKTAK